MEALWISALRVCIGIRRSTENVEPLRDARKEQTNNIPRRDNCHGHTKTVKCFLFPFSLTCGLNFCIESLQDLLCPLMSAMVHTLRIVL